MSDPVNATLSSRRNFLRVSSTAAASTAMATNLSFPSVTFGKPISKKLKVGLIGCGGRGTGAAAQAMKADSNVELWALGDLFPDHIERSSQILQKEAGAQFNVDPIRHYTGFDAYKRVIHSGVDIVLLATPPHFRPMHMQACIDNDKHVFVEKPVAVDATGVKQVIAAGKKAKSKGLSVVSGLCWRYETHMKDTIRRLQDGAIGDILTLESTRYTGGVGKMVERTPDMSDMEYQMRNWYYYTWLSGDFIVEQFVHELDKMSWLIGEYPESVLASGGRISRTEPKYGHIYDHFNAIFEYKSGKKYFASTRHESGTDGTWRDHVYGTEGFCDLMKYTAKGKDSFRIKERRTVMHQIEHDEFFSALRSGRVINNTEYMTNSTLLGIMARESAYTGKRLTWKQMLESKQNLSPSSYTWDQELTEPSVAKPGVTKFV
ncbi:Gfo/Idh/MocA family oxidoreductase [Verrucomicrobia bacterium]|nr:Gfo/Idh/MocA family oxidoreductase [Verrucomicrobiota bacterium]MDB4458939.1 Gfo/Idh/MocA family oxidoreductase [bacterium]